MVEQAGISPSSNPAGSDPRQHVAPRLTGISDWESIYGERRAFRIRGLTWFRQTVQRDIDKLKPLIPSMEQARLGRPAWNTSDIDWSARFSLTQVYAARRGGTLRFEKAAKVLLLCEVAAEANGIPAAILYAHMRLEPALFGLADFTEDQLAAAVKARNDLFPALRRGAGQTTERVFTDMAEGKAVSYRLAWKTRELLRNMVPSIPWGEVIIVPDRARRPRFEVSGREEVEGASVPAGAPDPFSPILSADEGVTNSEPPPVRPTRRT